MFSNKCPCDVVAVGHLSTYNCFCSKSFVALKDCFLIKIEPSSQLEIYKSEINSFFYCDACVPTQKDKYNGSYFEKVVIIPTGFKYHILVYCKICCKILIDEI